MMFTRVHDIEQMFGNLKRFQHGMGDVAHGNRAPRRGRNCHAETPLLTNVYDDGDALLMQVEVAGVAKEDLTIELHGTHLRIKGERCQPSPEGYTVHRKDLSKGPFEREYILPLEIAGDKVTSRLAQGILTLTLPKAEEAKARKITIQ
jgi:HSP20 family protein